MALTRISNDSRTFIVRDHLTTVKVHSHSKRTLHTCKLHWRLLQIRLQFPQAHSTIPGKVGKTETRLDYLYFNNNNNINNKRTE